MTYSSDCGIWGAHSGDYEQLLGRNIMQFGRQGPIFQKNLSTKPDDVTYRLHQI